MKYTFTANQDKISEFFSLHELACNSGNNEILINEDVLIFALMLDEFREWYNRSINPESWYRTTSYNKAIGGATYSQHLKALAIDVHFPTDEYIIGARQDMFLENVKNKWFEICDKYGVEGGCFFYTWGFHIDAGTDRKKGRSHIDFR